MPRSNSTTVSRRYFLMTAGAVTVGFGGLAAMFARGAFRQTPARSVEGYGRLIRDPENVLDLPDGFQYRVFSRIGETMDDGLLVPGDHDGMAAFPGPDGRTILIRNHELFPIQTEASPYGPANELLDRVPAEKFYDFGSGKRPCFGGTTTLVYNTKHQILERHFLSLTGTVNNCAGGPTPWNSWISCEETTVVADDQFDKSHGYNFEVPVSSEIGLASPVPLKAMGRFRHEAVGVDPRTGIVYQTEDSPDGQLYRFIPAKPGDLLAGGRLQSLAVQGKKRLDSRNWGFFPRVKVGQQLPVYWIDLDDIESPNNDLRYRGYDKGAVRFARAEGMWFGDGVAYFACTKGGWEEAGQIWKYTPSPHEGTPAESSQPGILELLVEPNDRGLIDNADNLTIAPWGDLFICEDGRDTQYLVGVTPDGGIYHFARNAGSIREFAGVTFSPDGTTLFANIQYPGLTLAITGPWKRRPV